MNEKYNSVIASTSDFTLPNSMDSTTMTTTAKETTTTTATTETEMNNNVAGDSRKSVNEIDRFCLICGQMSNGFHFGILACRACAAFFRRTIVEKKAYKCRQNLQCPIKKEMRNMCRACRYKKCEQLGMNKSDVQLNRDPIGQRKNISHDGKEGLNSESAPASILATNVEASTKIQSNVVANSIHLACQLGSPITSINTNSLEALQKQNGLLLQVNNDNKLKVEQQQQLNQTPQLLNLSGRTQQNSGQSFLALTAANQTSLSNNHNSVTNNNLNQAAYSAQANSISSLSTGAVIVMPQTLKCSGTANMPTTTQTITFVPYSVSTGAYNTNPKSNSLLLQRMVEGYSNFNSSQKSLYTVMYPDNIFSNETFRLVKHSEYVKMERGCLSLMFSMINDWFQPFDSLPHEIKVSVLRMFSSRFTMLDQAYRTLQVFPEVNDTRYALHYGQYMDVKSDFFFSDNKEVDLQMLRRYSHTLLALSRGIISRFQQISVREIEIATLTGIILWTDVATFDRKLGEAMCNRIYSELHNNMVLTYGVGAIGGRLGSLLAILHDLNLMQREINESSTIRRIFNPHTIGVWDEL